MSLGRTLLLAAGIAALAVGTVGIALPVLPTVPLYLLAAFCFARSNPAWERRLLEHRHYGPPLRAWRERGAISRRGKRAALATMAAGAVLAWLTADWRWALAATLILLLPAAWIWSRPD